MGKSKQPKPEPAFDAARRVRGRSRDEAAFPVASPSSMMPRGYSDMLSALKDRIGQERQRVVFAANNAMVVLYWDIGRAILERQDAKGWGAKVIDRLSLDLREAYPDMKGFSPRNLKYMRALATAWPDAAIVQRVVARLPWRQNIALLECVEDPKTRLWYAQEAIRNGWSQPILRLQIEGRAHERHGKAPNNFKAILPPADSDMAGQIFKDPYLFDFLGTADTRREREVEQSLMDHLQRFLLELGTGFAFVGRQVHLEVGDDDFYVDLLFYHLKLHCYVVIELKAVPFKPEFLGQLNMYLSAVDDLLRQPEDKPTIGLLLVKGKKKLLVEYALRGLQKPIGVAQWETKIVKSLPVDLKGVLPTVEELERELEDGRDASKDKKR